jgi:acyl-CoA synthetase (AMP-forming)/AMP-acid ligase II
MPALSLMDATARPITPEAEAILQGLPSRISNVIADSARQAPDRPAITDGATTWSYADFDAVVADTAALLTAHGIRPGDRVMIVSENSLLLAALLMAASETDAWAVVVNPRLSAREIDQIRDHSGARRVFYASAVSAQAHDHALRHAAQEAATSRLGTFHVGPLNAEAVPEPVSADSAAQVAVLMYTSGTTGNPKGVMITHRNLLFNARVSGQVRRLSPQDRLYAVLPMSHIVGLSNILTSGLMFGCTVQVAPRYDPAELARAIAQDGITVLWGVPATYQRLLEHKAVAGLPDLPRGALRYLGCSGAPLDLTLKQRIETEFGLPLLNGYGITECAPGISAARLAAPRQDNGVGQPIPGIETRIVGRDGRPVAPGEIGELHIRGPGVMLGYYRAPDLTSAAIDADGWFNSGDLVRFADGSLFVVGRTKEMIIRSGFNVYPAEVEAVLNAHPAVVQSAVVGRAVDGNEEVVAYVQLLPNATTGVDDLMRHAREQLTAYKRPTEIVVLEALPASSTGKILKHRLKA